MRLLSTWDYRKQCWKLDPIRVWLMALNILALACIVVMILAVGDLV